MITFILLGIFALLGIFFVLVAYTANNRRRAGMKGVDSTQANHAQPMRR